MSDTLVTELPGWKNPKHRTIEIVTDPEDHFMVCENDMRHESIRVRMCEQDSCEDCYGDDLYGNDFCPVCDYCCGC
jgi:hypothetical protein